MALLDPLLDKTDNYRDQVIGFEGFGNMVIHASFEALTAITFKRVRGHLEHAYDDHDLATPIIELSSSIALGFQFSRTANVLVERINEKVEELVKALEGVEPRIH